MPCKGHTKSRRGCLNCKRRRVKCSETHPQCTHCVRLGLPCEYPPPNPNPNAISPTGPMGNPRKSLSSTPTQFSMDDLRFFQHFLLTAYPPMPIGGDDIWRGVARLSHDFDYLVHAMLGLGASHLSLCLASDSSTSSADYSSQALSHRVRAISSLNHALSQPCTSRIEGDARFATIMALAFQSSHMPDGMLEFVSMVRGCIVVAETAIPSLRESAFASFSTEEHVRRVYEMSAAFGEDTAQWYRDVAWYRAFAQQGLASVKALEPLCQDDFERMYYSNLYSTLEKSIVSPVEGFAELCCGYSVLERVAHDAFTRFVDPNNATAQLLLVHFFLVEHEIGMLALRTIAQAYPFRGSITTAWIHDVAARLPSEYSCYMAWPIAYTLSGNMRSSMEQRIPLGGVVT
ncbi:hypothetical protein ACO1O0_004142 [Amphichorda felina]